MTAVIRAFAPSDLAAVVAINDAATPAVPIMSPADMEQLIADSSLRLVVDDGAVAGFLLAMPPGLDYTSENYRFFSTQTPSGRSGSFLYIDRIVLDARLRRQGMGARLYAAVVDAARSAGAASVFCEVNVQPPNPESLAFHAAQGFREIGRQVTKGGAIEVALLEAAVSS